MRFVTLALICASFIANTSWACSAVCLDSNAGPIIGKSYDWNWDHGLVTINKRNVSKTAMAVFPHDDPAKWTSKYGSLTFNQHGQEFPVSGINEEGLTLETLWGTAEHISSNDSRPSLNEVQWVQYQLDNFATVKEMIAKADEIRISKVYADVHYFACDATGACATFEYLNNKLKIHSDGQLKAKAFTNSTYQESADHLGKHRGFGGNLPIPPDASSLSRFVRVAKGAKTYSNQPKSIKKAFGVLTTVQQLKHVGGSESKTAWQLVYDLKGETVHLRTKKQKKIKSIDLTKFDFSCKKPVLALDMNSQASGDVTNKFKRLTPAMNLEMLKQNDYLPEKVIKVAHRYPGLNTKCTEE